MHDRTTLTRSGLRARRALRRFLYAQMQFRNALMIAIGREAPLVRFTVEADPPSLYLVFDITDRAGLERALDLPAPHRLTEIRCVEGDERGWYVTLNVYRVSGITNGTRAEWSVYVEDAEGVPRYMVIDARSDATSMDPVDVITRASIVDYRRDGEALEVTVGDGATAFRARLAHPADAPAVVTDREWSTANDFIYWRNGICDRTFYDGGMADAKVVALDAGRATLTDGTPWARFVDPVPRHILAFRDAIELVVSPWDNVDRLVAGRR
jgi:hypothetical protein